MPKCRRSRARLVAPRPKIAAVFFVEDAPAPAPAPAPGPRGLRGSHAQAAMPHPTSTQLGSARLRRCTAHKTPWEPQTWGARPPFDPWRAPTPSARPRRDTVCDRGPSPLSGGGRGTSCTAAPRMPPPRLAHPSPGHRAGLPHPGGPVEGRGAPPHPVGSPPGSSQASPGRHVPPHLHLRRPRQQRSSPQPAPSSRPASQRAATVLAVYPAGPAHRRAAIGRAGTAGRGRSLLAGGCPLITGAPAVRR